MNEGKFQKKYIDEVGVVWWKGPEYNRALEIIKELELALDTKNKAQEIRENGGIPDAKFLDAVKRYRDYGIE